MRPNHPTYPMEQWGSDRAADLTALVTAALPDEELNHDELLACCWDDPEPGSSDRGAVLATPDGTGAVVVVTRADPDQRDGAAEPAAPAAFVKLLAVHPEARRAGRGHALLEAAEGWAWDQGTAELRLAGAAPFYLWPGVDAMATEMLCLVEARGYEPVGSDVNMRLSTTFRAEPPEGVTIRRVLHDDDIARLEALIEPRWPEWLAETRRAVEHGCCHAAFVDPASTTATTASTATTATADDQDRALGFVCHSVNRGGWLGPMGTDPARRSTGIGRALLGQACRDLMIAEFDHVEVAWVGPARFYAKSGATINRVFRRFRLTKP